MDIGVEFETNNDFAALLNLTQGQVDQAMATAVNRTLLYGQGLIVEDTPVDEGNLRNSIAIEKATPDNPSGQIYSNMEYAAFVEYGTGVHSENPESDKQPIKLKFKGRRFVKASSDDYDKIVEIRGQKPAAMFRKNLPAIQERLVKEMERAFAKAIAPKGE